MSTSNSIFNPLPLFQHFNFGPDFTFSRIDFITRMQRVVVQVRTSVDLMNDSESIKSNYGGQYLDILLKESKSNLMQAADWFNRTWSLERSGKEWWKLYEILMLLNVWGYRWIKRSFMFQVWSRTTFRIIFTKRFVKNSSISYLNLFLVKNFCSALWFLSALNLLRAAQRRCLKWPDIAPVNKDNRSLELQVLNTCSKS